MGGIFSKPKAPAAPPSAAETAEAQAKANQVTQFTPQGNLLYGEVDPDTGAFLPFAGEDAEDRRALKVEETAFQESLRTGAESEALRLLGEVQGRDPLQNVRTASQIEAGLAPAPSTDFGAETQRLEDATFQAVATRLRPEFESQRERVEQRLADQGLPIGSDAYQGELDRLEESQNDQLTRVAFDSVAQGRAEQDRLTRLGAALRGQSFNEQAGLASMEAQSRGQNINELGALLGFNVPFQQRQTVPIDVAGISNAAYANQLAQQQAQNQARAQQANTLGTLGSIGGMLLSDKRLKKDIKSVGKKNGFNIYEFSYIWSPKRWIGVMAQEVAKVMPEAVGAVNGFMAVDYDKIGIEMKEVL